MGQTDWDTEFKYTIWPERLATDLSLCNVSHYRLNSLQQELLGAGLEIKAVCVRRPHALSLFDRNFTAFTGFGLPVFVCTCT